MVVSIAFDFDLLGDLSATLPNSEYSEGKRDVWIDKMENLKTDDAKRLKLES